MTDAPDQKPSGSTAAPKPAADEIERGDLEYWKERAQSLFGDSPHAIAGALSGDNQRKTWTEEQVKAAVKTFRDPKRVVGVDEQGVEVSD